MSSLQIVKLWTQTRNRYLYICFWINPQKIVLYKSSTCYKLWAFPFASNKAECRPLNFFFSYQFSNLFIHVIQAVSSFTLFNIFALHRQSVFLSLSYFRFFLCYYGFLSIAFFLPSCLGYHLSFIPSSFLYDLVLNMLRMLLQWRF